MAASPSVRPATPTIGPALLPLGHHQGKPPIQLARPVSVIGSRSNARIHLMSSTVSKAHALLVRSNGRSYIRDLASRTKVYINGEQVREADLDDGDLIKIGSFTFQYLAAPGEGKPRRRTPLPTAIAAKLDITGADYPVPIEQRVLLIGRRSLCDVHLLEESASTAHAVIFEMNGQRFIRDLGSRTGTFVNSVSTHQHQLTPGDTIRIGETELHYLPNEAAAAAVVEDEAGSGLDLAGMLDLPEPPVLSEAAAKPPPEPPQPQTVEIALGDALDIAPPLVVEEAPEVQTAAAVEEPIAPAISAEIESAAAPLSAEPPVAPESLSAVADETDKQVEPADAAPGDAGTEVEQAELNPRLGWRPAVAVEPAAPELDSAPLESPPTTEAAATSEAAQANEDVLKFPDSISSDEAIDSIESGGGAATAMLDLDSLQADASAPEEQATEEPPASGEQAADLAMETDLVDLIAPPPAPPQPQPVAELAAIDFSSLDLSDPSTAEAPAEEFVEDRTIEPVMPVEPEQPQPMLDLAPPAPAEESPAVFQGDPVEQAEESPRPLIASVALPEVVARAPIEAPINEPPSEETPGQSEASAAPAQAEAQAEEPEPPPVIVPVSKPRTRRGRKPAKKRGAKESVPEAPVPETAAAEAPQPEAAQAATPALASETVAEPAPELEIEPLTPIAEAPAAGRVEIIEPSEPTAESALESAADELALDALSGSDEAAPIFDELTDTKFDRAVRDFVGSEIGDIVEPPPVQTPQPQQAAEGPFVLDGPAAVEGPVANEQATVPEEVAATEEPVAAEQAAVVDEPVASAEEPSVVDVPPITEPVAEENGGVAEQAAPVQESPAVAPAPAEEAAPRAAEQPPVRSQPPAWGANQENFLGGVPLTLKQPPRPPLSETPIGDEAVKELIEEIDSAAAAAEAAAAPGDGDDEPPLMPAIPPRPRRGNVFRSSRRKREPAIPPYDGSAPTRGQITTGFDGLAMPPVREMDVFSQMSPPAGAAPLTPMDQVRAEHAAAEHPHRPRRALAEQFEALPGTTGTPDRHADDTEIPEARRSSVRPTLPGGSETTATNQRRPAFVYAAEQTEAEAAAIRFRYTLRVGALLGTMILFIALATAGIYNLMGVSTIAQASITYKNLPALNQLERTQFQANQFRLLKDDPTRTRARRLLSDSHPEIAPGYLDEQVDYYKIAERAFFAETRPDVLVLRVEGKDETADKARVTAIASALYEANSTLIEEAKRSSRNLTDLKNSIAQSNKELDELTGEIEKLQIQGEKRPTAEQIAKLESDVATLEKAWNESVAAVKAAEAELARVKSVPPGEAAANAAPVQEDEKLKAMQSQLDELLAKVNAAKSANSEQSAGAKKALDAALDAFQKQVADAQGMMNGNPELAAYVQAAQQLQETTRQLTDELIRRQEQQFGRLTELRERLNEKMEQRRIELWQNDKQLQELTERLAILTRQHNAALGGGLQKETDDLKVELDLTKNLIKARQDLLPGDSFYADAVQQLQVIIDSTRKNIDEDRKRTETLLTTLQKGFTSSQPAVEKLPDEQKQLAAALQKQLVEINTARQQYNQTVDAGAADSDSQLKGQMATLQAGIEARRKQLEEENLKNLKSQQEQTRLAAVDSKQEELSKVNQAETAARQAYFAKHKELRDAQALVADASASSEKLDEKMRQKDVIQRGLQAKNEDVENKQREVNRAVEPIKPTDNDIVVTRGQDRRAVYIGSSAAAIFLIFTGLILWTLHTASIVAPRHSLQAADLRHVHPPQNPLAPQEPAPNPIPSDPAANGKSDNGSESDHEPAVI